MTKLRKRSLIVKDDYFPIHSTIYLFHILTIRPKIKSGQWIRIRIQKVKHDFNLVYLVSGSDSEVRTELILQKDLTFDKAVDFVLEKEKAEIASKQLALHLGSSTEVGATSAYRHGKSSQAQQRQGNSDNQRSSSRGRGRGRSNQRNRSQSRGRQEGRDGDKAVRH